MTRSVFASKEPHVEYELTEEFYEYSAADQYILLLFTRMNSEEYKRYLNVIQCSVENDVPEVDVKVFEDNIILAFNEMIQDPGVHTIFNSKIPREERLVIALHYCTLY